MVGGKEESSGAKDHLFINYATEDARFVDWLGLKLASEGYAIWYDRYKLLGGEKYPQSIDEAISNRSFRMLSVLSRSSISKENPVAERTLGLNISRERKIDFVIPLNFDGLSSTELGWQLSPLNYIPFFNGWSNGLGQLMKTLEAIGAPRALANPRATAGRVVAINDVILRGTETLYSNILPVEQYPREVRCYALTSPTTESGIEPLEDVWAFYYLNSHEILSFTKASQSIISDYALEDRGTIPLNREIIKNVPTRNIVQNLIYRSVGVKCLEKGLRSIPAKQGWYYFPYAEKDWLRFNDFNGEMCRRYASGTHSARGTSGRIEYHWHLAPRLKVLSRGRGEYNLLINIGAYVTELDGSEYSKRLRNPRVKSVMKDWWNDRILEYQMAVAQLLSDGGDRITIGDEQSECVVISGKFLNTVLPVRINDTSSINQEALEFDDELTDVIVDEEESEEGE